MRMHSKIASVAVFLAVAVPVNAIAAETITYTYDSLGRLIKVVTSGTVNNGQVQTICYDEADNRVVYRTASGGVTDACLQQGTNQ